MRRINGICKEAGIIGLALMLVPAQGMLRPATTWVDPEFAYSVEKWAVLRDGVLEHEELADLIHGYSATAINNRLEYDEYRDKDCDGMKNAYQDIADRLYDSSDKIMDPVNEDQSGYAGTTVGAVSARLQTEWSQELADSQNEDGRVKKLEYDRQEIVLVKDTQIKMISYWQKAKARPALEGDTNQARSRYGAMAVRVDQGMAIQAEPLGAWEKMEVVQAALETSGRERDGFRRKLCVMTEWGHDIRPGIREVPVPDVGEIDQIDLKLDKERVLEQGFTQSANKRHLTSTDNGFQRDVMNQKIETDRRQIAAGVEARYKLLEQARADYEQAVGELKLARTGVQTAEHRYSLGMISRNEYTQQQGAMVPNQPACGTAGLKYRQALEDYRWATNGLAQTEGAWDMMKECLLLCIGILSACQYPPEVHTDIMPDIIRYEELGILVKVYSPQVQTKQVRYDSCLI